MKIIMGAFVAFLLGTALIPSEAEARCGGTATTIAATTMAGIAITGTTTTVITVTATGIGERRRCAQFRH
jgi:hypothetical protein